MKLKPVLPEITELPEPIQGLYSKSEDGKYYLQVEGMAPKDKVDEFRSNNIKLMKEQEELQQKLEQYKNLDPDKYKEYEEKIREIEEKKLLDEGQFEELFIQRTQRMQEDHKNQVGKMSENLKNLQSELDKRNQKLSEILIGNGIKEAMSKMGVFTPAAMEIALYKGRDRFSLDADGNIVALDSDGNKLFSKDGTNNYGFSDFAEELYNNHKDEPWYVQPSSGSGSTGSNDISRGGAVVISREEARDPVKYRSAQQRAQKEGKEFRIAS